MPLVITIPLWETLFGGIALFALGFGTAVIALCKVGEITIRVRHYED